MNHMRFPVSFTR